MRKRKWFYGDCKIVTRIPREVGEVWSAGYGIELGNWEAVEAPSNFDFSHTGRGNGPEVLLARDENGDYLLLACQRSDDSHQTNTGELDRLEKEEQEK